ncbi:TonB-dependent receptor domain-containing protein [Brevundimonas subvibrioides]|uniref:TonB-dependent receptor plug n=1 Tax=Brevundimonas subvibrioides (strain ATCC 15264 / DSM 4735 / LMG 14903 / NBRC 16000 / CB 81) TaxID=633149 RepID=D9QEZ6_BRESC|nr:TonB-dependent receptor [Brevundimonas subvibrioides]ADL00481.1 TonB-dependent receptor plug [Brevundimonas subvibrioides ATCC 15264]
MRPSPVHTFNIRSQRVGDALMQLALQSRRSLGGDIATCRSVSPGIQGRMTLEEALNRVLQGSGCRWTLTSSGAVIIRRVSAADVPGVPPRPPRPSPPPPTAPAPAPLETEVAVSDVVVTAERRIGRAQVSATSLSAVDEDRLRLAGVTDMIGLDALVPGMTVTNLGSGRNKILLRGMSDGTFTGLTHSTVGLYLDRVPLTYSAPDPDLKLIDVDRVEVLRGPQGTLYGTGPIGGIVRIVPRSPDASRFDLGLSLSRSWTRQGGENRDESLFANLPLFDGDLALRGVVYEERFGGYINDISLAMPRVNEGARRGGRLSLTRRLNDDWSATIGMVRQTIQTEDTHYIYRTLGGLTRANLVREPHRNTFEVLHAGVSGTGDWGQLDATVATVRHKFMSRYDASSALRTFGSGATLGALDDVQDTDLTTVDVTYASRPLGRWRWTGGAFYSSGTTRADSQVQALRTVETTIYREIRRDRSSEIAAYGQASYQLTPAWSLTGGARVSTFDHQVASVVGHRGTFRPFEGDDRATTVSPMISITWQPDDTLNLYGLVSQGRRTGGFNTAGPFGQRFDGLAGNPARRYSPDTLTNYELGAKSRFWDGRVQARATLFFADWGDIQSDQFLPSGLSYAVNVGDGRNAGLEVEVNWQATDHLRIHANGLFARPEVTSPSPGFNSRLNAGLPGVPESSANLSADYRRPIGLGLDLIGQATVAYVGESRLTFDAARRYRMGEYVTGRASIGVESRRWSATAYVENPFDTEANTFSYGDPFRLPEALASTPLRPITGGVTLTLRR